MKFRSLLAVVAAFFYLLVTPHWSSADPAPTTRPASQASDGDSHGGDGFGGGPGREPGREPGRGTGRGQAEGPRGMGPMQRGFGGGAGNGPRGGPEGGPGDGRYMQGGRGMRDGMRSGMQNRGQARNEDGDSVDQQTIVNLQSQIAKLSAQLDRMQKQLDERDGGRAGRGRRANQQNNQHAQKQFGKNRGFARQQQNGRGWRPEVGGPRRFQQQRFEPFGSRKGGPRGGMQHQQQNNRSRFGQSFNGGPQRGFGPMDGGPRDMRLPAFMHRFGSSSDRGYGYARGGDGPNERGWDGPRHGQQFNGYRIPPNVNQQQQRWNGGGDEGLRGFNRMNGGQGPRARQDDRGWNDNRDGRPAPDSAGPQRYQHRHRQNQPEDDSQQDGGPRFRSDDSQQR